MKRIGRRGRVLGIVGSEPTILDDVTKKYLLQAAGITQDVQQEMSNEEIKETLAAILESSPLLLHKSLHRRSEDNEGSTSTYGSVISYSEMADPEKEMAGSQNMDNQERITHKDPGDISDSDSSYDVDLLPITNSSTHLKDESQLSRGVRRELYNQSQALISTQTSKTPVMGIIRESSASSSQDGSAQLVSDSDEDETQRYDIENYDLLMKNTNKSPDNVQQKLTPLDIIPETQTADSTKKCITEEDEVDLSRTNDCKVTEDVRESASHNHTLAASIMLQPPMENKQDTLLTSIYRKHLMQNKVMLWSSLYTPQHIKNPDCYTQVIQLLFDIYRGRVQRAHKQMNGIVKAWGHPVIAGPHISECLVAKPSDMKDRIVEDGKSMGEWRGMLRTRLQKVKKVQMDVEESQTETYKDVDDFDLEFARTCRQPHGNQNRVLYSRNKCKEPNVKRDTLTQRGCQQHSQHVVDDTDDMNANTVESESDEWLPGKNKQVNLSKRKLKTRGDNTQKQVRQNRDCKKVNKGKRLKDNSETVFSAFHAELSVEVNTENQTHEEKKETDKTTWIGIEYETGLKTDSISEQETSILPGWTSRSSLPNVSHCLTLRDAYSDKQDGTMIEDKLAEQSLLEQSLHLHLEVDDGNEQVEVLLSDDEDNPWSTKGCMTPPFVSEDNNKVGYNNNHSNIKSADASNIISSSSQSSESLLDIHGNLYSTQMSRSGNHLNQDNEPSSSLSQQDVKQDLRCADLGSRSTVEQPLRNINRAEVKLQITKDKDETDLDGTKLKSQESSKLELNSDSGNLDNHSNDDNRDDSNKIDHHVVMIEGVEDMVCPVKTLSNTSTFTDNRRKRNLLTLAKSDQNFYNLKESVEGQSVEKRQKVKSEKDSVRNRTMGRNRKLISGETSKKGTLEEVNVLVISDADFSADYQMDSSVEKQTSAKQDGAIVSDNMCPICGKCFPANKLEAHASSCGEDVILETDEVELIRCISCGHRVPHGMLRLHQENCLHGDAPTKRVTRYRRE